MYIAYMIPYICLNFALKRKNIKKTEACQEQKSCDLLKPLTNIALTWFSHFLNKYPVHDQEYTPKNEFRYSAAENGVTGTDSKR